MFEDLTNFAKNRTNKQAVGFYLVYVIFSVLLGAVIGGFFGAILGGDDSAARLEAATRTGAIIAPIFSMIIFFLIYRKKRLNSMSFLFLGLLSAVLALLGGTLLGVIFPAFLTTVPASESGIDSEDEEEA